MFKQFICWIYGHELYWIYTGDPYNLELRKGDYINMFPGATLYMQCSRCGWHAPKW